MSKVKIGVIGLGNMGSSHCNSIVSGKISNLELTAVCDNADEKKEWAAQKLTGIPFFSDYKELIKSGLVDAVLIATPHYIHPDIAIFAFENGLHVLTEKPAGVFTKQVEEMNAAPKKSGRVFSIMFQQRTEPIYAKVHEMVKSGLIGDLKRFVWLITNWYRTQAYYDSGTWRATWAGEGGGVLINQCPHNLDLWQWITGMPAKIRGYCSYGKYHNIEVEDDVTVSCEYANGATGVFITTTGECCGTNRMEIVGDKGKLVVEDGKIKFWEFAMSVKEHCFTATQGFEQVGVEYKEVPVENAEFGHNTILQNFTNSILNGEDLIAPGYEGINGLTISNAIHLSDWTGETVELPIDADKYWRLLGEKIKGSAIKKAEVKSEIADLAGSYNTRWDVKW